MTDDVPAHDQAATHRYLIHYPPHEPRETDPHYAAFEEFKRRTRDTPAWKCRVGDRIGFDECEGGIEVHHHPIEFALINAVDFEALAKDYPALKDPTQVSAWAESDAGLMLLCVRHHRSAGAGAHAVAFADWEAGLYVRGLFPRA